jgi:RimJ/RimL family protein N-acetyltransferase
MTTPDPVLIQIPEQIVTERLVLAAPRPGLGQALNAAVCESLENLKPWMPWAQTAPSIEESEAVIRHMQADFIARRSLTYQIYQKVDAGGRGQLLGCVGFPRFDWTVRSFEIGYWIRRSAVGKGLVSETVQALTGMAFDELQARRVEIRMDDGNLRSRAVAERCGFEFEGVLRRDSLDPTGQARDTRVYSRIA